jgi:hypothetical protein
MKAFFVILFLAMTSAGLAQDLADIRNKINYIINQKYLKMDSTGLSRLKGFRCECIEDLEVELEQNCFHVTDLNFDGKKDVIYSGPCPIYSDVNIYLNKGTGFKVAHRTVGDVVAIKRLGNRTKIYNLYDMCCSRGDHWLEEIVVEKDSAYVSDVIYYCEQTHISSDNTFLSVKVSGVLRETPEEDDAIKILPGDSEETVGNHILVLDEPRQAFRIRVDGQWALVLVNLSPGHSVIGWINLKQKDKKKSSE